MIRILLVDDAPIITTSLKKTIEQIDEEIVVSGIAANGMKAVEWLATNYADICITDIRMPAMDGLGLMDHINSHYSWMKCMVISSYDDFEYAKASLQLRAVDYILKPVDYQALERTIRLTAAAVEKERTQTAANNLVRMLPQHRSIMEQWVQHIKTTKVETMSVLIVDTLELLERWSKGEYYMLNAYSNLWINMVYEEIHDQKLEIELEEGKDLGLGEITLRHEGMRGYFRLCAVRRLEEGSNRLIQAVRGVRDEQTIKIIEDIKRYIEVHFGEAINLQELADHVALNKTYMCTLFKQETNNTVWNYIVAVRMNRAKELLLKTSDKVYEIANSTGYEDVNYFSQLFKKHYGFSPLDFRKRMVKLNTGYM